MSKDATQQIQCTNAERSGEDKLLLVASLLTNSAYNVQLHQCIAMHTVSGGVIVFSFLLANMIYECAAHCCTYQRLCIVCTKGGSVLCR